MLVGAFPIYVPYIPYIMHNAIWIVPGHMGKCPLLALEAHEKSCKSFPSLIRNSRKKITLTMGRIINASMVFCIMMCGVIKKYSQKLPT